NSLQTNSVGPYELQCPNRISRRRQPRCIPQCPSLPRFRNGSETIHTDARCSSSLNAKSASGSRSELHDNPAGGFETIQRWTTSERIAQRLFESVTPGARMEYRWLGIPLSLSFVCFFAAFVFYAASAICELLDRRRN